MTVELYEGQETLEVVGEAKYQDNLWRIVGDRRSPNGRVREDIVALLAAEPDNPHDADAVAVWIRGLKVGYLSREDAHRYRPGLLALEQQHNKPIALAGVIAGGGMRADRPGLLGVFLDQERDLIDRHFMHAHLQSLLYRSRDVFASPWMSTTRPAANTTLRWTASGPPSWPGGARYRCWNSTGRWPFVSRRPRTLRRRCGGPSAASRSMGSTVLGRKRLRTWTSARTPSEGS